MEKMRINVHIAGRGYPLNVSASEEETLRKVGKRIENMIKDFERNFSVQDKQDALAMCALKLGVEAEQSAVEKENIIQSSIERLNSIEQKINEVRE